LAWTLAAAAIPASAESDIQIEVAVALRDIVFFVAPSDAASSSVEQKESISKFYATRDFTPAWTLNGRPNAQAEEAAGLLGRAAKDGLSSADYNTLRIARDLDGLRNELATASPQQLAAFDARLTAALIRYASHLAHGRIDPRRVNVEMEGGRRRVDVAALLQRALDGDQLTAEIEAAAPQLPAYAALKKALGEYRRLKDASLPAVPVPKKKIAPGEVFAGRPQLDERLAAFGDLDPNAIKRRDGNRYSGAIVEAVKRFQYRHGLAQDGVLNAATLAELNRPLAERVRQIEMGMERIRWLPPVSDGRFLLVNIPEFKLLAFDGASAAYRPRLEMAVIVGRAGKTPTPIFADELEYLDFSPYWNVPRSIAVKELLPKLKQDPGYLTRQGMELVGKGGRAEADAVALAELERGVLRLRQRPGTRNALGGVKFMFPNRHEVYLHSTPAPKLFNRTRRDFSHGCIRVADPVALAQFVLVDHPAWDTTRIRASMSLPRPLRVNVSEPLPILIVYTTAVVDTEGRVRFLPDIYNEDAKLARALFG
jgi:murein L,D-transpeptidase YcbB/YkuD